MNQKGIKMTGKQMCETIIQAIKLDYPDSQITPKELWNSDPSGELFQVFELYEWAKTKLDPNYKPPSLGELVGNPNLNEVTT